MIDRFSLFWALQRNTEKDENSRILRWEVGKVHRDSLLNIRISTSMTVGINMQYDFTYVGKQMVCWKEEKNLQQNKRNKNIKYNMGEQEYNRNYVFSVFSFIISRPS